jgi:hypothetical protein
VRVKTRRHQEIPGYRGQLTRVDAESLLGCARLVVERKEIERILADVEPA